GGGDRRRGGVHVGVERGRLNAGVAGEVGGGGGEGVRPIREDRPGVVERPRPARGRGGGADRDAAAEDRHGDPRHGGAADDEGVVGGDPVGAAGPRVLADGGDRRDRRGDRIDEGVERRAGEGRVPGLVGRGGGEGVRPVRE